MQIQEKNGVVENKGLPTLKVIPFQIQQLFNNLLNNALKFSKPEIPPRIVVYSDIVDVASLNLGFTTRVEKFCHISFGDNGIGFDPIYEKKIFEVFQRLHGRSEYGGTGIGLAICKKIVDNHHGMITAESRPDEGTTFHIYLPVLD
jgi:signal transduction histidine kinase